MRTTATSVAPALMMLGAGAAVAMVALSPAQKCEAGRNEAAGKDAACTVNIFSIRGCAHRLQEHLAA